MSSYLTTFIYTAEEPIHQRESLQRITRDLVETLAVSPSHISSATVEGRVSKSFAFSWGRFESLLDLLEPGSITIRGIKGSSAGLKIMLYLRHNPSVEIDYQPPAVLYFIAECGEESLPLQATSQSAVEFMKGCAAALIPLHGGITLLPNENQAVSEASLIGIDVDREPKLFVKRWGYDAGNSRLLWEKARRVYWTTLLGPRLAEAAGGISAARAAGAAEVTEVAGSLIIRVTGNIEDALSERFQAQTRGLTEWLWPHLIQNPADATGLNILSPEK